MRKMIVIITIALLSFGAHAAAAPAANACESVQCVVNCVAEVAENLHQARCRL